MTQSPTPTWPAAGVRSAGVRPGAAWASESYDELASAVRTAWTSPGFFSGWLIWPVTSAVAQRAIEDGSAAAFDDAMSLLAELTSGLTSEFAIRVLLRHDLDRALDIIRARWVVSDDVDVRRLASEGTRPYLPWAPRVPALTRAPYETVPVLTALYRDDSAYVRRSVANHLNDISRDHAGALQWMGFSSRLLDVTGPVIDDPEVPIGGAVRFTACVTNRDSRTARLSVDYAVHHRKANGTTTAKTFKLAVRSLAPGQSWDLDREHSFRLITTRVYHPGVHGIELLVNGTSFGRADFDLTPSVAP